MSFKSGSAFTKVYKSSDHFLKAMKRNSSWDRIYSAEGKAAAELLELLMISGSLIVTGAAVGAKVGAYAGPNGVAIGALIGAGVGAVGAAVVVTWYVKVRKHRDGSIEATFTPA